MKMDKMKGTPEASAGAWLSGALPSYLVAIPCGLGCFKHSGFQDSQISYIGSSGLQMFH